MRGSREHGEQVVGAGIEEDSVLAYAGVVQRVNEFWPDLCVTALVLLAHAGVEHHPESDCLHGGCLVVIGAFAARRLQRL
jgi:hypothetical protein